MSGFDAILQRILQTEFVFDENPNEEWKYGVTNALARKHGYSGPLHDLSLLEARDIYQKEYWSATLEACARDDEIADIMYDLIIKNGPRNAVKKTQQQLVNMGHHLAIDGLMGPATHAALDASARECFLRLAGRWSEAEKSAEASTAQPDALDINPQESLLELAGLWKEAENTTEASRAPHAALDIKKLRSALGLTGGRSEAGKSAEASKATSPAFDEILQHVLRAEGGYDDHPNDRGGKTKFGITEKTARTHGYSGDMRALPLDTAKDIYRKGYWNDTLEALAATHKGLGHLMFDMLVNHRPRSAYEIAQRALVKMGYELDVDGLMGPATYAALAASGDAGFQKILEERRTFYDDIVKKDPSQKSFIKGWKNRCTALEDLYK